MSNATCCLPVVVPTRTPWHQRLSAGLFSRLSRAWSAARGASERRACQAAMARLSPQTLRDIGMLHLGRDESTPPSVDWERGRWN